MVHKMVYKIGLLCTEWKCYSFSYYFNKLACWWKCYSANVICFTVKLDLPRQSFVHRKYCSYRALLQFFQFRLGRSQLSLSQANKQSGSSLPAALAKTEYAMEEHNSTSHDDRVIQHLPWGGRFPLWLQLARPFATQVKSTGWHQCVRHSQKNNPTRDNIPSACPAQPWLRPAQPEQDPGKLWGQLGFLRLALLRIRNCTSRFNVSSPRIRSTIYLETVDFCFGSSQLGLSQKSHHKMTQKCEAQPWHLSSSTEKIPKRNLTDWYQLYSDVLLKRRIDY